tara:strand:+ start:73 stop:465 length:393 start_codon:yes stop_codon:yes gene_type:complete
MIKRFDCSLAFIFPIALRNIAPLLVGFGLWVLSFTSMAQIISTNAVPFRLGGPVVWRQVLLPDPVTQKMHVFNQWLLENPDGTLSPFPGLVSTEVKELHARLCDEMGGTVAAEGFTWMTSESLDPVTCDL